MQLKKIDPKANLFHYFEIKHAVLYALYDDELDMPISYGSKMLTEATIRSLTKNTTIVYYIRDSRDKYSYKWTKKYEGKNDKK